MPSIERLDIEIVSKMKNVDSSIDSVISKLNKLDSALSNIQTGGFQSLASGINKLGSASKTLSGVSIKSFNTLAKGIEKLSAIDSSKLTKLSIAMNTLSKSVSGTSSMTASSAAIQDLAKSIGKFGLKSATQAATNIPTISKSLDGLAKSSKKISGIGNSASGISGILGGLKTKFVGVASATKTLGSSFDSSSRSGLGFSQKLKNIGVTCASLVATFYTIKRVLGALGSTVGSAMDYIESFNYYKVVYQKIGSEAVSEAEDLGGKSGEAYAQGFQDRASSLLTKMTGYNVSDNGVLSDSGKKNLGMDINEMMNYSAGFAQIADSMGLMSKTSENVSQALVRLGGDWSSLKNLDLDQTMTKLSSGLVGQTKAVRSLGIDISNATLQTYAYKYGLDQSVSSMDQATKVQLRMLAILDQSRVAYGDLANTINQPANQLRILKTNVAACARSLGNIFMPIVAKVLPYLNALAMLAKKALEWIGALIGANKYVNDVGTSIGSGFEGIDDLGDADEGISDVADDASDAADSMDDADKSAKELKNTLMSFDEINKLPEVTDTSTSSSKTPSIGGSTPSGGSTAGLLDDALQDALDDYLKQWDDAFNNMTSKADEIEKKLENFFKNVADAAKNTKDAFKQLWSEGLSKFGSFTWTALKDFYNGFLVPVGKWILGEGLPDLIKAFNNGLMKINWSAINKALKNFWSALAPFAKSVGKGLVDFYRDMFSVGAGFINKLPDGINGLASAIKSIKPETAEKIGYSLGVLFTTISAFKALSGIGSLLSPVFGNGGLFALMATHPYLAIAAGLVGITVALDKFGIISVDWNVLNKSFDKFIDSLKILGSVALDGIKTFTLNGLAPFCEYASNSAIPRVVDIFAGFVKNVDWNGLNGSIGGLIKHLEKIVEFSFDGILSFVGDFLKPIGEWTFNEAIPKLCDAISNLLEGVDWGKLNDAISTFLTSLSRVAIGIGSGIIDFITKMLSLAPIDGIINLLSGALNGLADILDAIPESALNAIGSGIGAVVTALAGFKAISAVKNVMSSIATNAGSLLTAIGGWQTLGVVAIIGGVALALKGLYDYCASSGSFGKAADELSSKADTINSKSALIKGNLEGISYSLTSSVEAQSSWANSTLDDYEKIAAKTEKSSQDTALMKQYVIDLVDKYPELKGYVDEQTGLFETQRDVIQQIIDKEMNRIQLSATSDSLKGAYQQQAEAVKNLDEAQKTYDSSLDNFKSKLSDLGYTMSEYNELSRNQKTLLQLLNPELKNCYDAYLANDEALSTASGTYATACDTINTLKDTYAQQVSAYNSSSYEAGNAAVTSASEHVKNASKSASDAAVENTKSAVTLIPNEINNGAEGIKNASENAAGQLPSAIANSQSGVSEAISTALAPFSSVEKQKEAKERASSLGSFLSQGLKDGVEATKDNGAGQALFNAFDKDFRFYSQIHSPSKVTFGYGQFLTQGLTGGISSLQDTVGTTCNNLVNKAKTAMNVIEGEFKNIGSNAGNKLVSGISDSQKAAVAAITTFSGSMVTALKKGYPDYKSVGSSIVEKVGNGISANATNATLKVNDIKSRIESYFSGASMGNVARNIVINIGNGITNNTGAINSGMNNLKNAISNALSDMYNIGQNAASNFSNGWSNAMHLKLPHPYVSSWNNIDLGDGNMMYTPNFSVQYYAKGGQPDGGQLFIARENGIPEMVGNMGGKNTVANNVQIVEGIKQGVKEALNESKGDSNSTGDINVYVGGEQVTDIVVKGINKKTKTTGVCPIVAQ